MQEEYQSTNEELLTSKEELQSLNEELTALNSQLQETLERQRITSNDLQNVLYSTDVATLFLDKNLNIRFFTPATKALFAIIPSDLGRPLSDLNSLAADANVLIDARTVLQTHTPIEREIEAENGACYIRRILPYHTQDNGIEGVVLTFTDITDRRRVADELAWPSVRRKWRPRRNHAFWPPPAMISVNRCRRSRWCRDCWRRTSRPIRPGSWWAAGRNAAGHVGDAQHAARYQPDRRWHSPRRDRRFSGLQHAGSVARRIHLSRPGEGAFPSGSFSAVCRLAAIPVCWSG